MSYPTRTALFGVSPLSLLLGRACCLRDRQPVGLYDPDPEKALRGALFLGISARREPDQLNPFENPLEVAIVAHAAAVQGLARLTPHRGLLAISLGPEVPARSGLRVCRALTPDHGEIAEDVISASIPDLLFRLEGSPETQKEAREFLQDLSSHFRFES